MKIDEILEAGEVIDRPPVKKQEEIPLREPGGSTVVILNDPVTPFEVVIEAVVYGTGLPADEAARRVHHSHNNGWAAVATYGSRDVAETVANKIQTHARNNTRYDHYKRMTGHQGPWPLAVEVIND
jgi:ATP-dependent Clp protease adapter protein ClpS